MDFFSVILMGADPNNPLNAAFGWLTRILYSFFGSYGWAMVFITIILRGILIPLNVRSQKSMVKQQALASKQAEIKRQYPDDKAKQQEEISKLLSANGAKSFGGCILPFLQLFILLPIYNIVQAPHLFITGISLDNLKNIGQLLLDKGLLNEMEASGIVNRTIQAFRALEANPDALREAVNSGFLKMGQLIDMNFLGFDLSMTPTWDPGKLFGADAGQYWFLMIIPFLVLATNVFSMWLNTALRPNHKEEKEAKARAKANPARADQAPQGNMEGPMKGLMWLMPLVSLFFTFTLPLAMGFYWVVGQLIYIIQQIVIYYLFTKPMDEKKKEMAAIKQLAFTKGINTAEQLAEEKFGKRGAKDKKSKRNQRDSDPRPEIGVLKEHPEGYQRKKSKK